MAGIRSHPQRMANDNTESDHYLKCIQFQCYKETIYGVLFRGSAESCKEFDLNQVILKRMNS